MPIVIQIGMKHLTFLFLLSFIVAEAASQTDSTLLFDHWFWPGESLPGEASTSLLPLTQLPENDERLFEIDLAPILFQGLTPTERASHILSAPQIPQETFTLECWILDHVNQPVGIVAGLRSSSHNSEGWRLAYYDHEILFDFPGLSRPLTAVFPRGFKKYFYHLVVVADGRSITLYVNGQKQAESAQPSFDFSHIEQVELSGYFEKELYMTTGHLLKNLRIWDKAVEDSYIQTRYQELCSQTEQGAKLPHQFHLTAGPYLTHPTQSGIEIHWETNQSSSARVSVGTSASTLQAVSSITSENGIGHITLDSLEPETRYYYEIEWTSATGEHLHSGLLSFATAVEDGSAWSFAVCGDPEARPHINQRMSELIWEERPNFLLNLGDLTDGGKAPHRFEWTYEYFAGMGALHQRIPVFPVAGNGESDLVWYRHYHGMQESAPAYYTFTYGNAQFFILDSNQKEELSPGGRQYEWLEDALATSEATWKFVGHHHAPFSSDENDYGNTWEEGETDMGDLKVRELVPLYEKYGVDIVFFGHLHMYERTWPIKDLEVNPEYGVVYLVSGGAGGNLEDAAPSRSWFSTKLYRGHHYSRIDIWGGNLFFKMYDLTGALKDYMELTK